MNPDNATKTNDGPVGKTPRDDQLCQLNTSGYQGHQSAHHQWQNAMHQGGQGWQNQVTTPRPETNHAHGNGYLQQQMLQPVYNTHYPGTWSGTPFVSHPNTTHDQQPQPFGPGQEFGAPRHQPPPFVTSHCCTTQVHQPPPFGKGRAPLVLVAKSTTTKGNLDDCGVSDNERSIHWYFFDIMYLIEFIYQCLG